jgi:hypothetical protein
MNPRFIIITTAFLAAFLGITAGALSLMGGMIDQAVAFTWPGLATAVTLSLIVPPRSMDEI